MERSAEMWSCQQCTLINDQKEANCRACGAPNPHQRHQRNGLLAKIKENLIPSPERINSALEKLDSAIDAVTSYVTTPGPSRPTAGAASRDWTCPRCSQVNPAALHECAWCAFNYRPNGPTDWVCGNGNCQLRLPAVPHNSRCPLCKRVTNNATSSNSLSQRNSASMPQITTTEHPLNDNKMGTCSASANPPIPLDLVAQMDDVVSENSEQYRSIVEFCRQANLTFVDDSFPHSMRSIGPLSMLEDGGGGGDGRTGPPVDATSVVWLRPANIVTKDGYMARWAVFNDPQPTDIEQGLLGNCWFISALAVVAERPEILERLFLTRQYNHRGVYEMRLCVDGLWQSVIVDDFFPCHRSNKTMIFAVGRKNQLWVSLIEKALAKVYNGYTQLRAGRTVEGLSTLTGAPAIYVDLEQEGTEPNAPNRAAVLDLIWARLLSAREAGYLMGCSCGAGKREPDEAEFRRVGLGTRHAYSILDVRVLDSSRLLRLRNPWGQFIWLGEWSWGWPGWTPERRSEVGQGGSRDETWKRPGTFWIPFERFVQYFDSVDIAQVNNGGGNGSWTVRYPIPVGFTNDDLPARAIRLTITEPTEVSVVLHQRGARTTCDHVDLMVLIHGEAAPAPGTLGPVPGEVVARSPRRIAAFTRTEDVFLAPGDYLVLAHSFQRVADGRPVPGTLVVHTSKRIFTEATTANHGGQQDRDLLHQRSLVELMLKEGVVETLPPALTRYLMVDFEGFMLMVDNGSGDHCLQVQSICADSQNVLSSRGSLVVADSIPPLHRQIVIVLTHFEPSQGFNVSHQLRERFSRFPMLGDFAADAPGAQNQPPLAGPALHGLHGPRPLYQ